jgi:hypothetical protein
MCGELRIAFSILINKFEGDGPLGESRCRWKNYIKVNVTEMVCEGVAGIN